MTDVKMTAFKMADDQLVGFKTINKTCKLQPEFRNSYFPKMDHFKENDNFYALILRSFDAGAK